MLAAATVVRKLSPAPKCLAQNSAPWRKELIMKCKSLLLATGACLALVVPTKSPALPRVRV